MNPHEAYEILGLDESASVDDVNKAFRKLAAQHHPDRNKDNPEQAEAEFKKINEAAQTLKNPPPEPDFMNVPGPMWANMRQHVRHVNYNTRPPRPPPEVEINLSFKESVVGCSKEIEFERYAKCNTCDGAGLIFEVDKCDACNGEGSSTSSFRRGNSVFQVVTECGKCRGTGKKTKNCSECSSSGGIPEQVTHRVTIPGGIRNGEAIRLAHAGHFVGQGIFSDVYILAKVDADPDMSLDDRGNVKSSIDLSLLEALKGSKKKVRTVKGNLTLNIRSGIKHGDVIKASGYGARGLADHLFNINVAYPSDIDPLIELLEKQEK